MYKTKVVLTEKPHQCVFCKGDIGYIDGYARAGDDRAYAIVVVGKYIDFVPINMLMVLQETDEMLSI